MPAKLSSLPCFHPYMAPGPNVSDIPFCPSASEAGADTVASSHHASSNDGSVDDGHWDPHRVFDYPGFDIYMGQRMATQTGLSGTAPPASAPNIGCNFSPEAVVPGRRPIPVMPSISSLALASVVNNNTGREYVPDPYLNLFCPPSPISFWDLPSRPSSPVCSDWDAAMMVRKYHVVKSRLSIKKALLDYFSVVEAYPLAAIGPTEDYFTLARRRLYHEVMHAMEKALAAAEEIEYAVNPEKGDDQYEPNAK
ncbi:hypothetical protein PCASD_05925 [Puccinia coronata f. sp. avenae]|uniref:Uncharacterized protein n=1 Tax=Puccinia coronata f. sp. avenae TaxID=200324 RepID=A0A2N5V6F2_9BASI|nr:hypothetical protein PCASD_05925 [Puccinia coronata f. sp. avenae]